MSGNEHVKNGFNDFTNHFKHMSQKKKLLVIKAHLPRIQFSGDGGYKGHQGGNQSFKKIYLVIFHIQPSMCLLSNVCEK